MAKAAAKDVVEVRTPNVATYRSNVDAAKYRAMKALLLPVFPAKAPGLTQSEMFAAVDRARDQAVFPGSTYLWWAKCVQLDLEARGVLVRERDEKPLRWHRAPS